MRTPDAAGRVALAHASYRKSSRSSATGSCVMVGSASSWVGIQDSKEHPNSTHRSTLAAPHRQWVTFLHAIKDDQSTPDSKPMSTRDEQQFLDAVALLRTLKPGAVPRQARRRLSLTGAYDSGRTDVATQSAEILRDELGRRDPHSS